MFNKLMMLGVVSLTAFGSVGCGKVCDQLETKMCTDLGEEDCKIWKEDLGGLESIRNGRKADNNCGNIMMMNYDPMLASYKDAIAKIKEARAPK
ncbi:MAG: hypothetical protein R3E66_17645 [bacterium]